MKIFSKRTPEDIMNNIDIEDLVKPKQDPYPPIPNPYKKEGEGDSFEDVARVIHHGTKLIHRIINVIKHKRV